MAQNDWRFAIEIHPPKWECPAEPFWIAGWIMARGGAVPVDVRAKLGRDSFLGLCGLPRPEIEMERSGRPGPPYAGFCFLFSPHAGATELRLEACDASGRWQEFFRENVLIKDGASEPKAPAIDVPTALLRLLSAHQANPHRSWKKLATETVSAEHAQPLNSLPNPPYFGALEQPRATALSRYGQIAITGWVAHRDHRIVRLIAFVDSATPIPLLHGLPRPDVTGAFADLRDATTSRFAGYCTLSAKLPLPACLRIFAQLENGQLDLVFAQRFRPEVTTGDDSGLPPLSRWTFWRASMALNAAARREGSPLGTPVEFRAAKRIAWENYRASAPVAISRKTPRFRTDVRGPRLHETKQLSAAATAIRPLRITLVTHNLNREGAPLIALEFARHLAAQSGWTVHIVSPEDGPLRESFRTAGLSVEIIDVGSLFAATNPSEFDRAIANLTLSREWDQSDVIVVNTMVAFWAVHLARRLGKPSLFYIHESASVRHFFVPFAIPGLIPLIESAFGLATRTVFSATATSAVHARLEREKNFRVVPGWIDVKRILDYTASHSPADLRRIHGLPTDAIIFSNIGSVTERKGQHIFVEAIDLLQRARRVKPEPTPPLVFLLVGASPSFYLDLLRHDIASRKLTTVQIIEHVAEAHAFFRLSDIFVCSSFEESLPRVVMEAAAFRLPIVSTDVNGVPEIVDRDDAWLVPAGDAAQMAKAMEAALEAHLSKDTTRAERSHRAVLNRFDSAKLLPRHAALVAAVAELPVH